MTDIEIVPHILPFDEAVSMIKRMRRTCFITVGSWAQYTVQNPAKLAEGLIAGTNSTGVNIQVTRAQAVQYLLDAFPAHWRPKLSIRVAISKRCMFVAFGPR